MFDSIFILDIINTVFFNYIDCLFRILILLNQWLIVFFILILQIIFLFSKFSFFFELFNLMVERDQGKNKET